MSMTVTFLALLSAFPAGSRTFHTCAPNTTVQLNGRLCICDSLGRWSELYCYALERQVCESGQIIWQGCNQCICQDNGQLSCTNIGCPKTTTKGISPIIREFPTVSPWCTPFKSFYVNCSICVCPASGLTSDAHCAKDISCHPRQLSSPDIKDTGYKNVCIPNVMYLFPCLHCLCSDGGYFVLDKCVETCNSLQQFKSPRRCSSGKFYRNNCNVCWCPTDGISNESYCTNATCDKRTKFHSLPNLRRKSMKCVPNSFTKPRCIYCDCNTEGTVNENACLDVDCLIVDDYKYDIAKDICSPSEVVPVCVECLCPRNGHTNHSYCTSACSQESKLNVLREILKDRNKMNNLIDANFMQRTINEFCEPNFVFMDQGNYCICPKTGNTNFKVCIAVPKERQIVDAKDPTTDNSVKEYSIHSIHSPCEPNTFVEFDCNTCYCSKIGIIDPKWCTYDDCESKRLTLENHKAAKPSTAEPEKSETCAAGSISNKDCNFCICPNNGNTLDHVCTKNNCEDLESSTNMDVFTCEPLAYYLVDCNICLCPLDGLKNVDKCTKNVCEKGFLRSSTCEPGELFSDDCNVCVCPPNSDKRDRVCTNHTCSESDAPWKRIFQISQDLLVNNAIEDTTRKLDVCFPGEEFVVGCKVCECPDMGLRAYATCTPMLCNEEHSQKQFSQQDPIDELQRKTPHSRSRRLDRDEFNRICFETNVTDDIQEDYKECTPGSMYIIRCKQCICPYMGSISHFCRPLPKGTYCEQAYPNYNYLPMGRRTDEDNSTMSNSTTDSFVPMNHNHTKHQCPKAGRIMDECFICECEEQDNTVVEEHCFKSNADECKDAEFTLLKEYKNVNEE